MRNYVRVGSTLVPLADRKYRDADPQRTAELVDILRTGSDAWNRWRRSHPLANIDLRGVSLFEKNVCLDHANLKGANLHGAHLGGISLRGANLAAANLYGAILQNANLTGAKLAGAHLEEADLNVADLTGADLRGADLSWAGMMMVTADRADLRKANLEAAYIHGSSFRAANLVESFLTDAVLRGSEFTDADLTGAHLEGASLVETNFTNAKLSACRVYGASVWKSVLENAEQRNLIITAEGEPEITVDNLKIAQFIYLILENTELRDVIDTITSKVVLILGRFTEERKQVLDNVKTALRQRGFLPVLFDFKSPGTRDLKETVSTLAHLARFVIADISDPRSVPQELATIVPNLPSVPVQPLLLRGQKPWPMFDSLARYPWVLKPIEYTKFSDIEKAIDGDIIARAEAYLRGDGSK